MANLNENHLESLQEHPFDPIWKRAYKRLVRMITTMELKPYEKLSETYLVNKFNIGRSPAKMALEQLEKMGLVYKSGKNYLVSSLSASDCMNICHLRIGLEGEAAYIAAKKIGQNQLSEMLSLIKQQQLLTEETQEDFANIDHSLHRIIIDAAENPYISATYAAYEAQILRYRFFSLMANHSLSPDYILKCHTAIYYALKHHNSKGAKEEVIQDISGMVFIAGFLPKAAELNTDIT